MEKVWVDEFCFYKWVYSGKKRVQVYFRKYRSQGGDVKITLSSYEAEGLRSFLAENREKVTAYTPDTSTHWGVPKQELIDFVEKEVIKK